MRLFDYLKDEIITVTVMISVFGNVDFGSF